MNGGAEAGERLALTLAGSLILHFALVFGLQIRPQAPSPAPVTVIQAHLVDVVPGSRKTAPMGSDPQSMTLHEEAPSPAEPIPEPAPAPRPETVLPSAAPVEQPDGLPVIEVPLIEDPTYYTAREVDVHPSALQAIQPAYPVEAVSANVTGSVVLLLLLDESGKVQEISVEEASPPGYFEKSAMEAFRNARFTPAQRQGRVVKSRMRIKVMYELTGKNIEIR